MKLKVNKEKAYGAFQGLGVSGAWWAQYVGGLTEEYDKSELRNKISSLLFSKSEGIGIEIYRYNIGAGSKDSKKGNIDNPLRRTESFETAPFNYDWSKDKNAVYMMKRAVYDGAGEVVLFVNSPPERLTKNKKSHLDTPFFCNLKQKDYAAFAKYTCDIAVHFINNSVPVKYISPVNEPVWIWTGTQEGCHYHPWQLKPLFAAFAREMSMHKELDNVMLCGPESGDLRFFNKWFIKSMLVDKNVKARFDCIDTHSYCTYIKIPIIKNLLNNRTAFVKRYANWAHKKYSDLTLKVSEWTHMKGGRDAGMNSALEQTKIIMEDIFLLDAVSWSHWIAVSEVDYCDGLIYIDIPQNSITLTKRYYCFGNISKYVKKGMTRVDCVTEKDGIKTLAYTDGKKTVLIAANFTQQSVDCEIEDVPGLFVLTDNSHNLFEQSLLTLKSVLLPPLSVATFVY